MKRILCGAMVMTLAAAGTRAFSAAPESAQPTTLREAVSGRFLIGTAINSQQIDDPKLADFIAKQFNCITAENEFKPDELEAQRGQFDFTAADKLIAFAEAHNMKVVGHNLCWHNQTGQWMFEDANKKPLPREKALENLKNHIDAVAGHFKGKVIGWDVVNEAISDTPGEYLRDTPARRAIGDDYIAKAFDFAHTADPDAQLYYNDYSDENPDKLAKTIKLIRELKSQGLRIDAVGIQGHFMLIYPGAPDALDAAIKAYDAEGVKVMISELDLDMLPRSTTGADINATQKTGLNPYPQGLTPDAAKAQADFYGRVFHAILKHPGVVTRVTFWGINDGATWLNDWPVHGRNNHPLLWDRDFQTKPAFDAVMHELMQPTALGANQ